MDKTSWALTRRALSCAVSAALLVSCGGGGDDGSTPAAKPEEAPRRKAQAVFTPSTPIPADAYQKGMWSPVNPWPLIAVHAVLMPDGRVLTYGSDADGKQTGNFIYDVWDPEGGLNAGHLTLPNGTGTDIFCSSQLVLPQGGAVFVAGGDNWTGTATTNTGNNNSNLFAYEGNSLARGNNMNRPRWYSSSTTLINGETYIQGGSGGTDRPEIRAADGSFRLLTGANTGGLDFMYPRNFVAPDGRVFGYDVAGRMYYVNTSGAGSFTSMGQFASAYAANDSSAAMFRPGRILQFGGNSNGAIVIDIRGPAPTVTPTMSMSSQRRLATGTLLPDGKVLATGGSSQWNALVNVNTSAEIWNPDTGEWTVGANGALARLYHSTALLLPDATVLVAGGGAPGPLNNRNIELYFPPYLFTSAGAMAPRPQISAAPTVLNIGQIFTVDVGGTAPVSRVVLVKTGSVTHGWNMEQRFVELTYTASGNRLSVQAPTHAGDAPPGFYMLFVLDSSGVPSVAKILRVNVADTPDPATTPTLPNPGDQMGALSQPATLQLNGSDPNGDVLRYSATGLPPGLAIDSASGLISGAPSTNGVFNVVVSVSDGVNAASVGFTWSVSDGSGEFKLAIPVLPPPTQSGSGATFTASSNGINTLYKWDFGDGTPETGWSSSPSATHNYTQPGLYYVTVTAVDDRHVEQRQTVLQAIYLPPTARKPAVSTSILVEPRVGANARVWVVNADNDSVSVFDAVTRARLAEIAVGSGPRALARASNGMVWVTNKRAASISVIDPATLAVNRTLTLTRGSQPYGIAMAPTGGYALVALEASGRLLKFDTASYAQTASTSVGLHARHVSISADGATAYVSRFITPPLPGESTASVSTGTGGGEVLALATGTMSVTRTLLLAHSDKPDAENQGRGLPNYLGAPVLSPDGTQAWVPSKQDNVRRGTLRDGLSLNFQNTVRAISSRLDLVNQAEDLNARIDHDNAGLASAGVFDARGNYLFVALETSREVAVVDAHGRRELFRFDVGRAPQGLALSDDGHTLYVSNFMDRSVDVFDLRPLTQQGRFSVAGVATLAAVGVEKLAPSVLTGKQFFYDARDTRLARDRYISCASCHNDGGHDGRVWDLTGLGEGLRNTISLRGRAGGQGFLHWSNNFDEVQDFEGQIRSLAGGTGLMADAVFAAGTRSQPLGDRKAGLSTELDALAAYVASLNTFDPSPHRPSAAALSANGSAGKTVFTTFNCASCHSGAAYTGSGENTLSNVGTVKPASGKRLWQTLAGIDVPTLRDVWATAPYLHDGSAATLDAAVRAHGLSISDADLAKLVLFLREIGGDEPAVAATASAGTGLLGSYFNNVGLTGTAVLQRTEAVDFGWGSASPGTGVTADNFSVRWTGQVHVPSTGTYRFQTESDDGVRLWVNGVQLVNNWTDHSPTVNTSAGINLVAGQRVDVRMEYYEKGGGATARLRWLIPGDTAFVAVPASRLFPPTVGTGLTGQYFNNTTLSGTPVLTRIEAVDFDWAYGSPGSGVGTNNFSARWTGTLEISATGAYQFQTVSDDAARVYVNGALVINAWTPHGTRTDTSANVNLTAGQRYTITVEYLEKTSVATMRLRWKVPGSASHVAIPAASLYTN
ncbi:PA14 domain-containing protein [Piscinibacter sp. XHJ-5]|uniref:PA14 domain-containing protein n=1 Tax=Piscinibacter sp. XHJ-5 TaxID=3037797 RepID=UPI002453211E|nr:PA14 domain-containing protein [Piscinibacter sp. XHJ-5]